MSGEYSTVKEQVTPNDILSAITKTVKEERFPGVPTPQLVYAFFRAAAHHYGVDGYSTYTSTALTSGGAARPDAAGERLPFAEALAKNELYSTSLVDAIIGDNPDHITDDTHVNPINLGKIPLYRYEDYGTTKVVDRYWDQGDYLRHWFAVIAGVEASGGGEDPIERAQASFEVADALFEAHRELTTHLQGAMNDYSLSNEARTAAYNEFTDTFIGCVQVLQRLGRAELHPVGKIVGLIDDLESLGCRSETRLARWLGATTLRAAVSGSDWSATPFAEFAAQLRDFKAEFSVPIDKIVLALVPKLPAPTDALTNLGAKKTEFVTGIYDDMWEELVAEHRTALVSAVSGDERGKDALISAMAIGAAMVTRDKRPLFHPHVINEVLERPSYVVEDQRYMHVTRIDQSVDIIIAEMRDPNFRLY